MWRTTIISLIVLTTLIIASYVYNPAPIEKLFSPNWDTCNKCDRPWNHAERHATSLLGVSTLEYRGTELVQVFVSIASLCEMCWLELETAEARLPFYRSTFDGWGINTTSKIDWRTVKISVFFVATGEIPNLVSEYSK